MTDIPLDGRSVPASRPFEQYRAILARYLRPQLGQVILMSGLLLASIALQLVNPQIIRYFLDTAQAGGGTQPLLIAALLFIGFAILQQGTNLAAQITAKGVGWRATNRLRFDLALHVLRLDMPFHKTHTPGDLIERVDGDVSQLANFFSQFSIQLLGNGLLVLGILVLLMRENIWLGVGMTVYTALVLVVLRWIQGLAVPRWAAERQATSDLHGFIEERISGAEEIRAAGAEEHTLSRLYGLMRIFNQKTRLSAVVSSLTYNLTNLVYILGYAAGLAVGVTLFLNGQASLGTTYLITYYIGMLSNPLQAIRAQVEDLQQAAASLQRIQELNRLQPRVATLPMHSLALPVGALGVEFDQVTFRYDDEAEPVTDLGEPGDGLLDSQNGGDDNILHEVSFSIQPGRVLGILGRTGSGKTTLSRLLFRLYDPNQGAVRLGGVDLCAVDLADLRRRVGMVTQDVQLFQASLRDNLTFFNPNLPDSRLEAVLKNLKLWDWTSSLPEGLDTELRGGQNLSAGEAQLLAFARVFLKDPGLVILDEASSRLDPSTEALMERAVDGLFAGRTGVVIAHRLKTVERADDILILEEGRVVEYGPRQELVNDPGSRFTQYLRTGLEETLV